MQNDFYPEIKTPRVSGMLPVGDGHELYYEEFGNPNGIPIVYLHGGPGAGHAGYFHRFFDPAAFRIIIYDQRGAGKSTPFGETKNNSPEKLVGDVETLRTHLKIGSWHVFGGSWGSTLALLYAQTHPAPVKTLTLRGIFMMREKELAGFYQNGNQNFPEAFETFKNYIPAAERGDLLRAYYNRIAKGDIEAAKVWTRYETETSRLIPYTEKELDDMMKDTNYVLGMAYMETHFFVNHKFTPDDRLLKNIDAIRHIPTVIVQGRYDSVCPPESAVDLKAAFPEADLHMVKAGHSAKDDAIRKFLVQSAERIRDTGTPVPKAP